MSDHTQQPRKSAESPQNRERQAPTEYVERSDVGVSLTVKLTRGTGTRDPEDYPLFIGVPSGGDYAESELVLT